MRQMDIPEVILQGVCCYSRFPPLTCGRTIGIDMVYACGLCGLLEPTQNQDILDWRPQDPAVPGEELIALNVFYEECL